MESNEIKIILDFISSDLLWLYFIIILLFFYGVVSFLTWSLKKPLVFLGVPTIISGISLLLLMVIVKILSFGEKSFEYIILMFKPMLTLGIIFLVLGILMIVVYKITTKNKNIEVLEENKDI